MRVKLNGILYETVEDAARVYNVVPNTIRRWLREGRENAAVVKFKGDKRGNPQPITIEGMTFPTQKAANDAFGLSDNFLTQALNRNSVTALAKVTAAARAYKEKNQ